MPFKCANILNIKKAFFPLENSKISKVGPERVKDKRKRRGAKQIKKEHK
jgi:hypothetical protein